MTLMKNIQHVFPRATEIPETLLKDIPCLQNGYLVNGEIRVWDGPRQEVRSPVWVAGDAGPEPFFVGEYPLLTETEVFQALDAAVAAKQTELNKQIITRIVRDHKSKFLATDFIL